jgi:HPt (histidine-containing phosphotransfer) domain-containing protein
MANGDVVLDPAVIESLRQLTPPGEADVLAEILTMFVDEVPKKIAALQAAVLAGDAAQVARLAHSLKGSSGNIGAAAMLDVCRRIDDLAKAGDLARVTPLVAALTSEYHRVELEIKHLLRTS